MFVEKQKNKDIDELPKKRRKKKENSGCPYYSQKKFEDFEEHLLVRLLSEVCWVNFHQTSPNTNFSIVENQKNNGFS